MRLNSEHLSPTFDSCYEFLLLNVNIGCADLCTYDQPENCDDKRLYSFVRDTIKFEVDGHLLLLRRPVSYKGELVPAGTAYFNAAINNEPVTADTQLQHAMLQVSTDDLSLDQASDLADEVSCLLSLCFGQHVVWHQVGVRKQHKYQNRRQRSVSVSPKASGSPPISNDGDGRLKSFIENAWPIFTADKVWWRYTIRWFCIASESNVVEVSGMIFSMLIERVSKRIVESVPNLPAKQIGDDLAAALDSNNTFEGLTSAFTALMLPHALAWTDKNSQALLNIIKGWNNSMPYKKGVEVACAHFGLKSPSQAVTKSRDHLMHSGMLKSKITDNHVALSAYDSEVHQIVQIMMLSMFGYEGRTFVPGKRDCSMTDFQVGE